MKAFATGLLGSAPDLSCPYCASRLARNTHEAETLTGRFIFPALIFAAIATVLFIYIQQIWPIVLAVALVVIALVYEQWITTRRVPPDWPRWKLRDTREHTEALSMASYNSLIIWGVLLIGIGGVIEFFVWPKVFLALVLVFLVGVSSILAGITGFRKHRKREAGERPE